MTAAWIKEQPACCKRWANYTIFEGGIVRATIPVILTFILILTYAKKKFATFFNKIHEKKVQKIVDLISEINRVLLHTYFFMFFYMSR